MPAVAKTKQKEEVAGPSDFRIGFLVHDVSRLRKTLFDQEMEHLSITRAQWWALAQLSREERPEGMLQIELARRVDVGKGAIGGLISRLEAGGFVVRTVDKTDRRAQRVRITRLGHKVLEQMTGVGRSLNGRIFADISAKDIETAERVLATMKRNIKQLIAQPGENGRQRGR
ncbi:MarR family transcriptional regulator [Bradyrhizobium sp. LHD-71]|uniref:MarR family winged helix-turn-helix transcriptional regulator n=1 Tax=Bradyrhizobium sp. LHD-71 TaxID=3072141 RepID=UPI00280D6DE2|nr:MarR family transcriptional regulator [Bradyrhizobium sp. LHD-71]MDQ8732796.1 MarR family transcriptional regulator [Bradyrhizobium sp. LHD-71]